MYLYLYMYMCMYMYIYIYIGQMCELISGTNVGSCKRDPDRPFSVLDLKVPIYMLTRTHAHTHTYIHIYI